MSNFISIKWDRFLAEGEAEHFPWLKEIQATDDLEEQRAVVESDRFKKVGGGSFRKVYQPVDDPEYVIKLIHDNDDYKMRMNEDDFDTARRYPFIFPKAYAHADDFSWIVMEKTPPLIYPEDMQKVLDKSFPTEQEALLRALSLPTTREKDGGWGFQWNPADPFHIMKMIMASFRFNRKELPGDGFKGSTAEKINQDTQTMQDLIAPVAGAAYQELSKVMHEFAIDKYEIGRGNIGHDRDYNFKIVDSSVFDPDWDPDPEYSVDEEENDNDLKEIFGFGREKETSPEVSGQEVLKTIPWAQMNIQKARQAGPGHLRTAGGPRRPGSAEFYKQKIARPGYVRAARNINFDKTNMMEGNPVSWLLGLFGERDLDFARRQRELGPRGRPGSARDSKAFWRDLNRRIAADKVLGSEWYEYIWKPWFAKIKTLINKKALTLEQLNDIEKFLIDKWGRLRTFASQHEDGYWAHHQVMNLLKELLILVEKDLRDLGQDFKASGGGLSLAPPESGALSMAPLGKTAGLSLTENWRRYLAEEATGYSVWDALLGLRDFKGATASGIYGNKVRPITYLAADSGGYGNIDLYTGILEAHFPPKNVANVYKILDLIKSEIGEGELTKKQLQQLSSKYNIPAYIKYENASKALQKIINSPYRGPKPLYRGLGITLSPQDVEVAKNDHRHGAEIIKNSRKGRPGYDINWIISKKATSWSFEKNIAGMFATSPAPHSRLDYDEGKKKYVPVILVLEDPKRGLLMDFGEVSEDTESEAILPDWQFTDPLEYEISGPMDMIFIKVVQK